jgi:hypothetical protein
MPGMLAQGYNASTMTVRLTASLATLACVCTLVQTPQAQKAPAAPPKKNPLLKLAEPWPEADVLKARHAEAQARPLFQSAAPLEFTLTASFNEINKDHNPESKKRYPGVLTVAGSDGAPKSISVQLSARGHFRRMARNCSMVPLRVEFPRKGEMAGTPFDGQTTLKLGTGCESSKEFEQYTLREYLAYPLYNMVTPLSFRARLGRATYADEKSTKKTNAHYAIFIEHENDVARRNEGRIVELPRVVFNDVEPQTLTRTMLYEYMVGNTDVSIWALHNVVLVQNPARTLFVVPYDFDLAGLVHAPYAIPDRRLGLRSVLDRMYRGPCRSIEELDAAAAPFRAKKADMLALVESMRDLDSSGRNEVKDYLESFFRTIEKPDSIKKQFVNGCKPLPTM